MGGLPQGQHRIPQLRCSRQVLNRHPVDIFAVITNSTTRKARTTMHWEQVVRETKTHLKPKIVCEMWTAQWVNREDGPTGKSMRTRWRDLGYDTRTQRADCQHIGGALIQPRLIVIRIHQTIANTWTWLPINTHRSSRPMNNLLTPPGLIPYRRRLYEPEYRGFAPDSHTAPMPSLPGQYIQTEKGIRRLLPEEFARGLGIPKTWDLRDIKTNELIQTTSLFHWEYLAQCLSYRATNGRPTPTTTPKRRDQQPTIYPEKAPDTIHWKPPDLSEGGVWYRERLQLLIECAHRLPNPTRTIQDGKDDLRRHRGNYDHLGANPKTLQLLWWEFPPEHHADVRDGASMNFLRNPTAGLTPNSVMTPPQLKVAGEFVDELIELGVLRPPPSGRDTLLNAPLFVVPKPGQPGQWRTIADMLRGGQNTCIGADPTILPRANDIVVCMYAGGYSAVVDLSKYFHNFKTKESERQWLGTIHPVTNVMYEYFGLPMGSSNSPAIACRIGQGFLRLLRSRYKVFQGKGRANCYWTGFTELGYDPARGYGFIMENSDGLTVQVWGFVDDFLIHGPTHELVTEALHAFLDTACRVGFLCHPKKCVAPCQSLQYIGFVFDTTSHPTLKIPTAKRERALAMTHHLLASPPTQRFSRLSLAVVAGVLQSLVDATPAFIGNTYLRQLHSTVHPPGLDIPTLPYYSYCLIPEPVRQELQWWANYLATDTGRVVTTRYASTFVPTWGDGSGTGTGGTIGLPNEPLKMWQGQWTPTIYRFSSNTKELATLLLTMSQLRTLPSEQLQGATIFYFTDNSTTYYISQASTSKAPHLHRLIEQIRLIELELGCHLQVIHVPGVVMITQGTDALSRGVWCSPFHGKLNQRELTANVFAPLAPDFSLVEDMVQQHSLPRRWTYCDWNTTWTEHPILDHFTVWFPPPELARPLLLFFLNLWSERPWSTSALFAVPRILAGFWMGLSRHVTSLAELHPTTYTFRRAPPLPIPVVVLYISPFTRQLPDCTRLDRPPAPQWHRPHHRAAEQMRGLS